MIRFLTPISYHMRITGLPIYAFSGIVYATYTKYVTSSKPAVVPERKEAPTKARTKTMSPLESMRKNETRTKNRNEKN